MPDRSSFIPQHRDIRIDVCRGLALLIVFVDHIRGNPLADFTPHRLGFSDMAEVFIFLSGYVCGASYDRTLSRQGLAACQLKAFRRAFQLYAANLIVLCVLLIIATMWHASSTDAIDPLHSLSNATRPGLSLQTFCRFLALTAEVPSLAILPLYIILLMALPSLLAVRRGHALFMLVPSVAVYVGVQFFPDALRLPDPWRAAWYFNPFAWQLVFVLGAAWGAGGKQPGRLIPQAPSVVVLCLLGLELAFVYMILHEGQLPPLADKVSCGPLRILHFACLVVVVRAFLPRNCRIWYRRALVPIATCGRYSLLTYCSGSVIAAVSTIMVAWPALNVSTVIVLTEVGCALVLAPALLINRLQRDSRSDVSKGAASLGACSCAITNDSQRTQHWRPDNTSPDTANRGTPFRLKPTLVEVAIVSFLLSMHAGLLAWIGYRNSPALDEVGHLAAGVHHWQEQDFTLYKVNPPLVRTIATLPVVLSSPITDWSAISDEPRARSEFVAGREFINANGPRSFWLFTLARWACIPFSLIGGYVSYRWARTLYGPRSGLLALALWCVSPEILANGAMITPDLAAAALGVTASFFFYRWILRPAWTVALLAGLLLGAAALTKTTWVVLFFLWPHLWLFWSLETRSSPSPSTGRLLQCVQLGLILLIGVHVVNMAYGYEHSFQQLSEYQFVSEALNGKSPREGTGNRFETKWLGSVPVPCPEVYLQGIDIQKSDFERKKWSYLAGSQQLGGWWYWYCYALLVKVPLGIWLLAAIAALLTVGRRRCPASWRQELILIAPLATVMILVSSQTGFSRYLRYILPCFPFAFIWASKVVCAAGTRQSVVGRAVGLALSWVAVSSLATFPHNLSYFNELAGGPFGGHAYLVDANIDWGQDLLHLRRWLNAHPEAQPLHLAYFGIVDPSVAGISSLPVPELVPEHHVDTSLGRHGQPPKGRGADADVRRGLTPGWYAVSVNNLRGYKHGDVDNASYTYFMQFKPVATAGYSIYIYHLTAADVATVR